MKVTLYHNPRCRKSREVLALLQEKGYEPQIVEYLKTPPSPAEISGLLDKLGMEPRDLMRKKEIPYKDLNLGDASLSKEKLIQAMADNPILIERPIAVAGNKAVVGRPPEQVLEVL